MRYTSTHDAIAASRAELLDSLTTRSIYEQDENAGDKTVMQLGRYHSRAVRLDAFTLAYAAHVNLDWNAHINSHRRSGDRFNIYAISKIWEIMRVLNGGDWDIAGNDGMTCAGVVDAMQRGITLQKAIEFHLNEYASDVRNKSYSAGNTQASSSLRAMEALGIVSFANREGNGKRWQIANHTLFEILAGTYLPEDAAPGDVSSVGSDDATNADMLPSDAEIDAAATADAARHEGKLDIVSDDVVEDVNAMRGTGSVCDVPDMAAIAAYVASADDTLAAVLPAKAKRNRSSRAAKRS